MNSEKAIHTIYFRFSKHAEHFDAIGHSRRRTKGNRDATKAPGKRPEIKAPRRSPRRSKPVVPGTPERTEPAVALGGIARNPCLGYAPSLNYFGRRWKCDRRPRLSRRLSTRKGQHPWLRLGCWQWTRAGSFSRYSELKANRRLTVGEQRTTSAAPRSTSVLVESGTSLTVRLPKSPWSSIIPVPGIPAVK
jgi:hypothetical protein